MNILFLDTDPRMCAYAHCDEHVIDMIPIYTKLLSTVHHVLDPQGKIVPHLDEVDPDYYGVETGGLMGELINIPYTAAWIKSYDANYMWMHDLWFWMHKEYWYRYDKMHEDWTNLYNKLSHTPENITEGEFTAPPGPIEIVEVLEDEIQNSIETSRQIYIKQCKETDAKWGGIVENMRTPPSWILENANV
mgnify:CR=1 FL=1